MTGAHSSGIPSNLARTCVHRPSYPKFRLEGDKTREEKNGMGAGTEPRSLVLYPVRDTMSYDFGSDNLYSYYMAETPIYVDMTCWAVFLVTELLSYYSRKLMSHLAVSQ